MRWIPDADACRRWAGPRVTFPLRYPRIARQIDFAPDNAYSLFDGEELVGFAQLLRRRPGVRHMTRVCIAPGRRGARCGRRLCEGLIEVAGAAGARCISLFVYRDNLRALHLYRSLGWVRHKRVPGYGPPDGLCYMVKSLPSA
jgi:ribosomal protein S18 acetylase RimI-like enzyme